MVPKLSQRLFNALPDAYALIQPSSDTFLIEECNKAYRDLLEIEDLEAGPPLFERLADQLDHHPDLEPEHLRTALHQTIDQKRQQESDILKFHSGRSNRSDIRYLRFIHIPLLDKDGKVEWIIQKVEDLTEQLTAYEKQKGNTRNISSRQELHIMNEDLQQQINYKITQYEAASKELNDFIYSVSHDLRAPLRRIDGFSQELINEYIDRLDDTGAHYLRRVRQGAQDMGNLIDDLLKLSRISRRRVERTAVNISGLAKSVCDELVEMENDREIEVEIQDSLITEADEGLMKALLMNLFSNAIKYTAKEERAVIKVGRKEIDDKRYFFIQDNGVGFDPAYSGKLFKAFDRLHSQKEFPGTGIGLATVKRIINLHGGEIFAESSPGEGATFYFNVDAT